MAKKSNCKNPKAEMTRRQSWAVFCMTGVDIRGEKWNREEVSTIISGLKSDGEVVTPEGTVLLTKQKIKAAGGNGNGKVKYDKVVKPFSISKEAPKKDLSAVELFNTAEFAGVKAMEALIASQKVAPMVVQEHSNPLDDNSPVKQEWVVKGGPCGFAWVNVKCKNSASRKFINELKKSKLAGGENAHHCKFKKSSYYGGFLYWVHDGGQSMAYKEAFAKAFTEVLERAGISAHWSSRMD